MNRLRTTPAMSVALAFAFAVGLTSAFLSSEGKRVAEPRLHTTRVVSFAVAAALALLALVTPLAVLALNRGRTGFGAGTVRRIAYLVFVVAMSAGLAAVQFYQDGLGCGVYC